MASEESKGNAPKPIKLKDPVGRFITIPFEVARTWSGMEEIIKQAMLHIDVIGLKVMQGHYDIIGPDGDIILPSVWERLVQPGWAVSMHMRPMGKPGPSHPPPGNNPFGVRLGGRPGEVPPPPPPGMRQTQGGHPPRPPGWSQQPSHFPPGPPPLPHRERPGPVIAPGPTIEIDPRPSKKQNPMVPLSWMAGKPIKSQKQRSLPARLTTPARPSSPRARASIPLPPPGVRPGFQFTDTTRPKPGKAAVHSFSDDSSESETTASSTSMGSNSKGIETRLAARKSGLVIVVRRQAQTRGVFRSTTFPVLEKNTARTDFSSARIYQDELDTGLVSLELTKCRPSRNEMSDDAGTVQMRCIEVMRDVMDFEEFEHLALFEDNLSTDPNTQLAVQSVLKAVRDKKLSKSRRGWYIKPGTVMRCDVDAGAKTVTSATFISVPYLFLDTFGHSYKVDGRKGICIPRRLHENFNPYDTSLERDKNQLFRKHEGAKSDQILWIGEMWVLILDSVGILTYGNIQRQTQLSDNIEIREAPVIRPKDRMVQVTDLNSTQFQLPLGSCETFFVSNRKNLGVGYGFEDDISDFDLRYFDSDIVTAKSWSHLVKNTHQPLIRVVMERAVASETGSDAGDDVVLVEEDDSEIHTDKGSHIEESSKSERNTRNAGRATSAASSRRSKSATFAENGFFGIQKIAAEDTDTDSNLDISKLDPRVPPFLGWSALEAANHDGKAKAGDKKEDYIRKSVEVCLTRTEEALREGQHPLVAEMKSTFAVLDLNPYIIKFRYNDIQLRLKTLEKKHNTDINASGSRFSDERLRSLYRDYLLGSVLCLEAFTQREFPSPLISMYYGALLETMQEPKPLIGNTHSSRWVVSRHVDSIAGYKYLGIDSDILKCPDCGRQTIFNSAEKAVEHLRTKHGMASVPQARLSKDYVFSLSDAAESKLREEHAEILRMCRDTVVGIAKRARDIQDGVIFEDQFRQPAQGIPYALLKSLQLIVAFVCAVPVFLDEIQHFYKVDIFETKAESLALPRALRAKCQTLKNVGLAAEGLIKSAERALSSVSQKKEDVVKFFTSVGPYCVATQMVCNLLRNPIHNNAGVAELYEAYSENNASQARRRPNKRQIPAIGAMMDEIGRLRTVIEWQQSLLAALGAVLSPKTHLDPDAGMRNKMFEIEDYILDVGFDYLQDQADMLTAEAGRCGNLIDTVSNLVEIIRDDNSRAVLVFTVVTVVFLPLSFVASYLSMSGGPQDDGWIAIQALFWEIAAPLAVGVGVFCLGVAWSGSEIGNFRDWFRGRGGQDEKTEYDGSECTDEIVDV